MLRPGPTRFLFLALCAPLAAVALSSCGGNSPPPRAIHEGQFPPPLAEEAEGLVREIASEHRLVVVADFLGRQSHSFLDGFESLSLWILPTEEARLPVMTVLSSHASLSNMFMDHAEFPADEVDALATQVANALEERLGLKRCRNRDRLRGFCVSPAAPSLVYLMDFGGAAVPEPGQEVYDLAARHGARVFSSGHMEKATGVAGSFEERLYVDKRTFHQGRFPLLLTNMPDGRRLRLSVFERGVMPPDDLDALVGDAKATLEARYGRPFCRADPATETCDAEHRGREAQRGEWRRARAGGAAGVAAFLVARGDGPHAPAARERLSLLRRLAEPPPPAPAAPAEKWIGRRAGETFADRLDDGSPGPRAAVVPAGVFRMGCAAAAGCRLEELPVHDVRAARPFALSVREVTHAEYYRFARPDKRLDPSWADHPATHLTWAEAAAYAAWLSERTGERYRLPSEAEWERAARAGTVTAYHWGDDVGEFKALCVGCTASYFWVASTYPLAPKPPRISPGSSWRQPFPFTLPPDALAPVGTEVRPPNAWGLFDMHGNAAEWTADCWHPNHLGAPPDGAARADGDCSRRVVRGGSYDTPPRAIRSAARVGRQADERYLDVGFRVLRELRNVDAWRGG